MIYSEFKAGDWIAQYPVCHEYYLITELDVYVLVPTHNIYSE